MSEELLNMTPAMTATVTAVNAVPVGTVLTYAGSGVPNGWLLCDGQQINASTYPQLYEVVGGAVPDLRSRFIVGAGNGPGLSNYNRNDSGGAEKHQLSTDELPAHTHGINMGGGWQVPNAGDSHYVMSPDPGITPTLPTGSNVPHENRPPFYALTYIIKY